MMTEETLTKAKTKTAKLNEATLNLTNTKIQCQKKLNFGEILTEKL